MTVTMKKMSVAAVAALTVASLTACANTQKDSDAKVETATSVAKPATSAPASSAAKSTSTATAAPVSFTDAYVKAKPAEKNMTGIFGVFKNTTGKDVKLESFTTDLGAPRNEIHEVVNGVMQMKQGGITIPAGGEYVLKPGSDHLMIMDIDTPIEAGTTVKVTLNFSDGTSAEVDAPVRSIASGQENYGANGGVQGNTGMSPAATPAHHG